MDDRSATRVGPGALLVAAPGLLDPNFRRTVVYLIEHRERGSLGVVLNRPSEVALNDVLPGWAPLSSQPPSVFVGGPVVPEGALAVSEVAAGQEVEGWRSVLGQIGLLDLNRAEPGASAETIAPGVRRARLFAGHAGWTAGQLEGEIATNGWFVVDSLADDAFVSDPARLWRAVMARQPGRLAWFANCPPDPTVN